MLTIDLNADLGESPERLADGSDAELMRHITSANIACGGHAGDANTMQETLELARDNNVAVGAHPGYPDKANFGRSAIDITIAELERSLSHQINELVAIAQRMNMTVAHVKPHGALYHVCNQKSEVAAALGRAVLAIDSRLVVVGQAASRCLDTYSQMGLRTAAEAFADRTYEADGSLRNRKLPGALIESADDSAAQALSIVTQRRVTCASGTEIAIAADTLCIHSDTPNSALLAGVVRDRLEAAGVRIQPF